MLYVAYLYKVNLSNANAYKLKITTVTLLLSA